MERKTTAKLDETKAAVKAVEEKAAAKVEETKTTVKEAVEEKKEEKAAAVKAAVKEVAAETKEAAVKAKEAVKETVKDKKPVKAVRKPAKAEKEELKPEIFIQFQNREAVVEEAIEKAKSEFVADGHRASSIKSLQIYLKPEEYAAYYVINKKFAGRVDLF